MSKIDGLNGIVQILRRKISEKKAVGSSSKKPQSNTSDIRNPEQAPRISLDELHRKIQRDITELDPNDSDWEKNASECFIGSVMAWEFGDDILKDSKATEIVEEVSNTIITNIEISDRFKSLLRNFIAQA